MEKFKRIFRNIPVVGGSLVRIKRFLIPSLEFKNSAQYWEDRYRQGGNSGAGSYGRLAAFKARVLNEFVAQQSIISVVEYGVGDGEQLSLANYQEYTGFDVSTVAVDLCKDKFAERPSFEFLHITEVTDREGEFDLALSLDVIYHLIEDDVFDAHMCRLFRASRKYVIIYAYDYEKEYALKHESGRKFTDWVKSRATNWELVGHIKNEFPYDVDSTLPTSPCDFYIYKKKAVCIAATTGIT